MTNNAAAPHSPGERAQFVRDALPAGGLFADQHWRTAPAAFALGPELAGELESLGRVLLQFYRAVNLLYRKSAEGKQPAWIAQLLDQGKPAALVELQRDPSLKNELPRSLSVPGRVRISMRPEACSFSAEKGFWLIRISRIDSLGGIRPPENPSMKI